MTKLDKVVTVLRSNWAVFATMAVTLVFMLALYFVIQEVVYLRDRLGREYIWHGVIGSASFVGWIWMVWVKAVTWLAQCDVRQAARERMRANAANFCGND